MTENEITISAESTMKEVLEAFPGARRALFAKYHLGGCQSCAFSPEETIGRLCDRSGDLPVEEVVQHIATSHENDQKMLISSRELAEIQKSEKPLKLLDVRTREEHEEIVMPGAELFTQDMLQTLFGKWPKQDLIVIFDHQGGGTAMDAAGYLLGHEFRNVKCLRGGIDQYSMDVDASISRYQLETEEA